MESASPSPMTVPSGNRDRPDADVEKRVRAHVLGIAKQLQDEARAFLKHQERLWAKQIAAWESQDKRSNEQSSQGKKGESAHATAKPDQANRIKADRIAASQPRQNLEHPVGSGEEPTMDLPSPSAVPSGNGNPIQHSYVSSDPTLSIQQLDDALNLGGSIADLMSMTSSAGSATQISEPMKGETISANSRARSMHISAAQGGLRHG